MLSRLSDQSAPGTTDPNNNVAQIQAIVGDRLNNMPLLELENIRRSFGGVHALAGVDLVVDAGEAVGLLGDNGAGKSTLLALIAGNFEPSAGEIRVDGRTQRLRSPGDARAAGIEVVYQDLALCPNLTATENLFLGREQTRRLGPFRLLERKGMRARARELLEELGSDARPDDRIANLSGGQRQAVAIARTRLSDARIVLFDEPTAAISVKQVSEVLALIRRLKQQGVGVLLVSHRLPDVFETCDRLVVLRRGQKVADVPVGQTSPEHITGLITGAIRGGAQPEAGEPQEGGHERPNEREEPV